MSERKQPVPTNFLNNKSLDIFDKMLFSYLRSKSYNSDSYINFYHGNKYISFEIKRGQTFFIINEIVKGLGVGHKRVQKSLEKIKKTENEMEIERKPYGCLITWVGYDCRIKMENESLCDRDSKEKRKKIEEQSSEESVKSEENVKSGNETEEPPQKNIEEFRNRIHTELNTSVGAYLCNTFLGLGWKIPKSDSVKKFKKWLSELVKLYGYTNGKQFKKIIDEFEKYWKAQELAGIKLKGKLRKKTFTNRLANLENYRK